VERLLDVGERATFTIVMSSRSIKTPVQTAASTTCLPPPAASCLCVSAQSGCFPWPSSFRLVHTNDECGQAGGTGDGKLRRCHIRRCSFVFGDDGGKGNEPGVRLAETYEDLRPLLFSIAYRMLGSLAEAEDIVQEAFLRYQRVFVEQGAEIESPKAYLSAVTTRLAIDHQRSGRVRKESYIGEWLPEPLLAPPDLRP
jgi:sigma-70-like protein